METACLLTGEYHLERLFAVEQHWEDGAVFQMRSPRPTSALLYVCACTLHYDLPGGKQLRAVPGDVVYLPQGSTYRTCFTGGTKQETGTKLMEFITLFPDGEPFVFAPEVCVLDCRSGMQEYFAEMIRLFQAPVPSPAMERAVLYRTLASIGRAQKARQLEAFASIAEGIIYLETDVLQEKSIAQIADMCHVSPSCFRRLFRQYAGKSPMQYQMEVKLAHAKRLLQSHTMSVTEVADALHFSDPAYFCRIFKKHVGISPRQWR